jgi:trimethyllysine dioxygenase
MATRIRCSRLTRLCGPGVTGPSAARKSGILKRSFSSTRIFAQDTETAAPTHGFSNGQNLGSIALKKNSIYLEHKLRIVRCTDQRFMIVRF